MPELPEVETSRRGIEPYLLNQRIKNITIRQRQLRWPVPGKLPSLAEGQVIREVNRRAKYLYLKLDNGNIIIHLGMSGSLRICNDSTLAEKHDHVDFTLSNNHILRLRDPRKFGCVLWQADDIEQHKLIKDLGPEPLDDDFNTDYFYHNTRNRSCSIKALIMNSHVVVGVGNIYACESLFRAGINPKRKVGNISKSRISKLVEAIKLTLQLAIEEGGTTLRDFTGITGQPGYFAQKLLVYGRTGKACVVCDKPIKQFVQQARSTFYCPRCQR